MNKDIPETKTKKQKRCYIIKEICEFCNNGKLHTNGVRKWCSKCKREKNERLIKI